MNEEQNGNEETKYHLFSSDIGSNDSISAEFRPRLRSLSFSLFVVVRSPSLIPIVLFPHQTNPPPRLPRSLNSLSDSPNQSSRQGAPS